MTSKEGLRVIFSRQDMLGEEGVPGEQEAAFQGMVPDCPCIFCGSRN